MPKDVTFIHSNDCGKRSINVFIDVNRIRIAVQPLNMMAFTRNGFIFDDMIEVKCFSMDFCGLEF